MTTEAPAMIRPRRVAVVGAGILGVCAAYHLAEDGHQVTVYDGRLPASRTTAAGAGFVGAWSAGYASFWGGEELALQEYGIDFYRGLAEHEAVGLRANGNMYVALSEQSWSDHVARVVDHELAPSDVQVLGPDEVERRTEGLLQAAGVYRAVLQPSGVQVSAADAARAIMGRALARGVRFRSGAEVTELVVQGERITGVVVDDLPRPADAVVVAAGAWANRVLSSVQTSLPLMPVCASRVLTVPCGAPGSMPTVMVPELGGLWVREDHGALTYGNLWGYAPVHELGLDLAEGLPRVAHLVADMRARLDQPLSVAMPGLVATPVLRWVQGLPLHTPDRRFLVGEHPQIAGLFVASGDNEAGVTHGPGIGRALAELIRHGEARITDLTPFRLDRFAPGSWTPGEVAAAMPVRR